MSSSLYIQKLSDSYFVSPQIDHYDISFIKESKIKTVFCNRPNGEDIDQPDANEIEKSLIDQGIKFIWQPISGPVSVEDVEEFQKHFQAAEKPILAYCRSGGRSSMLFKLANVH